MLSPQPSLRRFQQGQCWDLNALEKNPPKLLLFYLFQKFVTQNMHPTGLQQDINNTILFTTEKKLLEQCESGSLSPYHSIKLFFKCPSLLKGREELFKEKIRIFQMVTPSNEKSKRQIEKFKLILNFSSIISS